MAKTKTENVATTENINVVAEESKTEEVIAETIVNNNVTYPSESNVYTGVIPDMPTEPVLEDMVELDIPVQLTAADVVEDLRVFITKHKAIAEGNGYKAEYINYKSFVEALLRKLNSYEV